MTYETNYLEHHGIKGQRWGTRRFQNEDGSLTAEGRERYGVESKEKSGSAASSKRYPLHDKQGNRVSVGANVMAGYRNAGRVAKKAFQILTNRGKAKNNRAGGIGQKTGGVYDRDDGTKDVKRLQKDAKKDAEDMARAKAYYGEGAGNRRKQIRNRISERMKDPDYKAEYEKNLAAQDMSKHQKAANRERHVQDAKNKASEIGNGLKNLLLGAGTTSVAAILIYNAAKMTGADKKIAEFGKKAINDVINKAKSMKKPSVSDYDWSKKRPNKYGYDSDRPVRHNAESNQNRRKGDIVEKNDQAKHGTQRHWIDKNGHIH